MPRKARSKNAKKAPKPRAKGRRPAKARRIAPRKPRTKMSAALINYAKLINDPCNGPLVRSLDPHSATSLVQRARKSVSVTGTVSNGYAIWFPSYTNGTTTGLTYNRPYNLFVYETANTATPPVNTTAAPLGTGGTSGLMVNDPLFTAISPTVSGAAGSFARVKTLAACMQVEYTGSISAAAGQVAVIRNLSAIGLSNNAIGTFAMQTVDNMFAYAATRSRLDLNGHEVKWSPSEEQQMLRTAGTIESTVGVVQSSKFVDSCWYVPAAAGTLTTYPSAPDMSEQMAIVIAWRDIPLNSLNLNFYKVGEIELSAYSGLVEEMRAPVSTTYSTADAVNLLNSLDPEWQLGTVIKEGVKETARAGLNMAGETAFDLAKAAFAPTLRMIQNRRNLRTIG